ncbi:helix-turn-helix transcriptional regulator [Mycobacteroides abscessus]|uniref:helix-turn-helix transcriptional regulator n=1 Tax=Mycobacteroides abscessus TaxID=36809 RepID=UPI00130013C5|nr:helix-turn-helix transcriptional regulator [Mycobacteroides abscessus]
MEPNEQQAVGQRLRSARETLGLTQEDVSGALGIQRTSVIAMEAGKRNVSALELRRLARLYRRSVAWILGEEPSEQVTDQDQALYRATTELSPEDKAQVLRFAEFLAAAKGSSGKPTVRPPAARRQRPSTSQDG